MSGGLDRRLRVALVFLMLVFAALGGRLWQLQVVHGQRYEQLSEGNRLRRIPVRAPRGLMLTRDGEVLVGNRLSFTVSVVPGGLRTETLSRLARILGSEVPHLQEVVRQSSRSYPYEPLRVLRDVPPEAVVAIEENRSELPGVLIEEEPVRSYPHGSLAAHAVGYVQIVNPEDLARNPEELRPTDMVGRSGLERYYEGLLRGKPGFQQVEVDAASRPLRILDEVAPVPGNDLVLTVDLKLQRAVEEALGAQIQRLARSEELESGPEGGAAVVLEAHTGAVLAMASLPAFDPNRFVGPQIAQYFREMSRHPLQPFLNRVTSGLYPPGSTFKVVTAASLLENGIAGVDEQFFADGIARTGNVVKVCWTLRRGVGPPGFIDVRGALEQSCNDYFWELGAAAGVHALAASARSFGLGRPLGLDIYPGEKGGLVPDPDWKRSYFSRRPPSEQRWYEAETMDMAIGQGFLEVTPLQLAAIYMAVANRGTVYRPYLVQEVRSPTGEVVARHQPEVAFTVPASARTWRAVHEGLRQVITGRDGTARYAFAGFPIPVAGKTGSAEVAGRGTHGWFAAYAPADRPQVVVAVLVELGGGGASAAAPVARRILEAYFGLEPQPILPLPAGAGE